MICFFIFVYSFLGFLSDWLGVFLLYCYVSRQLFLNVRGLVLGMETGLFLSSD